MTYKEIIFSLPNLTGSEIRDLRARIDFLLKGEKSHNENKNGEESLESMLLELIHRLCRDHGLESRPVSALRSGNSYNAFVEKVPQVMDSLNTSLLDNRQLRAVLRIGLDITLRMLITMGVPVSASVLMNQIHRIPGVLDTEFPSLREAGMLKLIVRYENE